MHLTRAADYAVRVMVYLSNLPPGSRASRPVLAEAADVPDCFVSKVLQRLVKAKLIRSYRGVVGGFELASPSDEISLLDVIEAIEGPIELNLCLMSGLGCNRQAWCAPHFVWIEAQEAMVRVLRSASMERLARESTDRLAAISRRRGKRLPVFRLPVAS